MPPLPICEQLKEEASTLNAQLIFWVNRRKTLSDRQQIAEADKVIGLLNEEISANTLQLAENDCLQPPVRTLQLHNYNPADIQASHSAGPNSARAESDIAANPNNPLQLVGASKKFRDIDTYDFWVAVYTSSDGGDTWTDMELPPGDWGNDLINPVIVVSDPTVTWDDKGRVYVACSAFGRVGSRDGDKVPEPSPGVFPGSGVGIAVWTSHDGGQSWPDSVLLRSHGPSDPNPPVAASDTRSNDDKLWPVFNPVRRELVIAWGFSPMIIAKTPVDAPNWEIRAITDQAQTERNGYAVAIVVLSSGSLAIAWCENDAIYFGRSKYPPPSDAWNVFDINAIASGFSDFDSFPKPTAEDVPNFNPDTVFPHFPDASFRVEAFASMATDRDTIFIVWPSKEGDRATTIRYIYSKDRGTTWQGGTPPAGSSLPQGLVLVGAGLPPPQPEPILQGKYYFQPQVTMGGEFHAIGCTYYFYDAATKKISVYLTAALRPDGLWQTVAVTNSPWDPTIDAIKQHGEENDGLFFIGDYFGLASNTSGFFPLWMDTRTGIAEMFTARVDFRMALSGPPGGGPGPRPPLQP